MQTAQINLPDAARAGVVGVLNELLADEFVLYTKTRKFHWDVVGPRFSELHEFFEKLYEQLNDIVDAAAERSRMLGGTPFGTLAEFSQGTRLTENAERIPYAQDMIAALLEDHELIIGRLREGIDACMDAHHDVGTTDFLTGILEQHEKMAWMLRSHLQQEPPKPASNR